MMFEMRLQLRDHLDIYFLCICIDNATTWKPSEIRYTRNERVEFMSHAHIQPFLFLQILKMNR